MNALLEDTRKVIETIYMIFPWFHIYKQISISQLIGPIGLFLYSPWAGHRSNILFFFYGIIKESDQNIVTL